MTAGGDYDDFVKILVFLVGMAACSVAAAGPDEAALGKGEGYPVCTLLGALTEERCFVGGFSHFDELMPAHRVAKGDRITRLRDAPDASVGADRYMEANRNTGLLVLQGDRVLAERYQYGRGPEDRFTSMSMAKTVLAVLFGIALSEASIASLDDTASRYVPELAGTPYGETKLRDLLTMSSGVKFTENYGGRDDIATLSRRAMFHQGPGGASNVQGFTERAAPAGTRFHYASAESEVLGLVLLAALDGRSPSISRRRSGSRWARRPTRPGSSTRRATSSATSASTRACATGDGSGCCSRTTAR